MRIVAIDLDRHLLAKLLPTGAAVVALRAAMVVTHHHPLADARRARIDGGAERNHDAAGLVACYDRALPHRNAGGLCLAFRTAVLVQVTAAHAGGLHLDHHVM